MAIYPVPGVRLATVKAGIRYPDRRDLVLLELSPDSACAALFTRNAFCAAPVLIARQHWQQATPRYLVINTGNANAGTGQQGLKDALATCQAVARLGVCQPEQILPFSTGVIGEPLPMNKLLAGLAQAHTALQLDGWDDASWGILTTDTRPKLVSKQIELAGQRLTVTGIAKGSGMIKPDMATMLAFIATDAEVEKTLLQHCLADAVADSFNAITVDGDTSTNDACVLVATGQSGIVLNQADADYRRFTELVNEVCAELAQGLIRDAEGASKFMTIEVEQGQNREECRQVAYTIGHSPLVKTAFFASDPNWGRILAAVGRAGLEKLEVAKIAIFLDDICIVEQGQRAASYSEAQGQAVMDRQDITVRIVLGRGAASARIWTSDLSHDYVRINAEYRS